METEIDRDDRFARRLFRSFVSAQSYGLVLVLIVITYMVSAMFQERWTASIVLVIQMVTVWLALRTSQARRQVRIAADVLLALAAGAAVTNLVVSTGTARGLFVAAASALLYLIAPFSIIRHLAFRRRVDQETVLGAVAAYLLIGMFFAFAYRFISIAQAGPFFGANGEGMMSQYLFFSFITLTTTGYGNLVPATNPGQSLAVLEAVVGQLFLVTALAKVVNAWTPKRLEPAPRQDPPPEG